AGDVPAFPLTPVYEAVLAISVTQQNTGDPTDPLYPSTLLSLQYVDNSSGRPTSGQVVRESPTSTLSDAGRGAVTQITANPGHQQVTSWVGRDINGDDIYRVVAMPGQAVAITLQTLRPGSGGTNPSPRTDVSATIADAGGAQLQVLDTSTGPAAFTLHPASSTPATPLIFTVKIRSSPHSI